MEMKKFFSLFILTFAVTGFLFADNPGEEVESQETEVAEESVETEVVDTEVVETSTEDESSSVDDDVVKLQKVVVTGTRIKRVLDLQDG